MIFQLWEWCKSNNIYLCCLHLPEEDNSTNGCLSTRSLQPGNRVYIPVFQLFVFYVGLSCINLFATLNKIFYTNFVQCTYVICIDLVCFFYSWEKFFFMVSIFHLWFPTHWKCFRLEPGQFQLFHFNHRRVGKLKYSTCCWKIFQLTLWWGLL